MKKEQYGEKFHEHLIEQYKLYVEIVDRIGNRRDQTNRLYISLLSGLLALLSLVINVDGFSNIISVVFMAVSVLGIILCVLWYINIRSYRQLSSGKFKVVCEMEQQLPFPCFDKEWEILGKGKEVGKYLKLTVIEQFIPFILAIPYLALLAYSLYMWSK